MAVPDEVYRQARIKAAERGRSVSSLVAEFLASLDECGDEFDRLLAQQEQVVAEIEYFQAGPRVGRDEIYKRQCS